MTTIPAQLRKWRKARGLSQSQAAPVLGLTKRTLENWEQGTTQPRGLARVHLLQLLAKPAHMEPPPTPIGKRRTMAELAAEVESIEAAAMKPYKPLKK